MLAHVVSISVGSSATWTHTTTTYVHSVDVLSLVGCVDAELTGIPSSPVFAGGSMVASLLATCGTSVGVGVGRAGAPPSGAGGGVVVRRLKDDHGVRARPLKTLSKQMGISERTACIRRSYVRTQTRGPRVPRRLQHRQQKPLTKGQGREGTHIPP